MLQHPLDLRLGDTVVLKKPHPCGSQRWQVMRLGADIRLRCEGCGRLVMMPRSELGRRAKKIEHLPGAGPPDEQPGEEAKGEGQAG